MLPLPTLPNDTVLALSPPPFLLIRMPEDRASTTRPPAGGCDTSSMCMGLPSRHTRLYFFSAARACALLRYTTSACSSDRPLLSYTTLARFTGPNSLKSSCTSSSVTLKSRLVISNLKPDSTRARAPPALLRRGPSYRSCSHLPLPSSAARTFAMLAVSMRGLFGSSCLSSMPTSMSRRRKLPADPPLARLGAPERLAVPPPLGTDSTRARTSPTDFLRPPPAPPSFGPPPRPPAPVFLGPDPWFAPFELFAIIASSDIDNLSSVPAMMAGLRRYCRACQFQSARNRDRAI
mmetsp:Transcript_4003/g.11632  ORF Transcript_4003/g.11632 Transcript_4003/m.11632 type:complete len:291 (+) Transcript_4003:1368-2240(+)